MSSKPYNVFFAHKFINKNIIFGIYMRNYFSFVNDMRRAVQ